MFADNKEPIIYNELETIVGEYIIKRGVGKVIWYCNGDEGKLQRKKLNNVL